jgi:hypothetical protein
MKRVTLLCGLLLALSATVAAAGPGVGIRWNACLSDGGLLNKNFACNVNTGTNLLVGTFELNAAGLAQVSGNEVVIDLASATTPLPQWWAFKNTGTCRQTALAMNFSISALAVNCADWAQAQSAGGIGAYNIGARGPNTARIVAAIAVPPTALQNLLGGQEYFSFNVTISNVKSVGTGSCTGCQTPVCIVFNSINLTTPILQNNIKLSGPSNSTDADFCTWQGGAGVIVGNTPGCGAATPTKNATWGAVKALYH